MRTTRINTATRFTGLLIALALFAGVAGQARAQEKGSARGGARLLMRPAPAPPPSDYKPMSCAKCKDQVVRVRDTDTRGLGARTLMARGTPTKLVSKHLCEGCGVDWTITGHGKAKQLVATHKCTSCGAESVTCCNIRTTAPVATKGMERKIEVAPLK